MATEHWVAPLFGPSCLQLVQWKVSCAVVETCFKGWIDFRRCYLPLHTYNTTGCHRQSRNVSAVTVRSSWLQMFIVKHSTANEEPIYRHPPSPKDGQCDAISLRTYVLKICKCRTPVLPLCRSIQFGYTRLKVAIFFPLLTLIKLRKRHKWRTLLTSMLCITIVKAIFAPKHGTLIVGELLNQNMPKTQFWHVGLLYTF